MESMHVRLAWSYGARVEDAEYGCEDEGNEEKEGEDGGEEAKDGRT